MGFFDLFGKKTKLPQAAGGPREEEEPPAVYSGMRVEVTTEAGALLFVAKLMGPREGKAELHQYSEAQTLQQEEALHVKIRGYNDHTRKAVYMEGVITPATKHTWLVEELTVARVGNDRAFFRLSTNLSATATMFSGLAMGEKPCKLLNISVGGACISSESTYHEGDKFLLKVKLIEDRPESAMFCQVLRVIAQTSGPTQYGCKFLELVEEDQEKIMQNIFAAQRQQRGGSGR